MSFVTYKNDRNPHVTIHLESCSQIAKHGGKHKHGQGEYRNHKTYEGAKLYAEGTTLRVIECSFCLRKPPPAVRILPLNRLDEFQDCNSAGEMQQRYFLDQLPFKQDGCYYYRSRGLNANPGTVVLFQCDGSIIASAVFQRAESFAKPNKDGFRGGLYVDRLSIRVFDPLDADRIRRVWPTFKKFSQVRQRLAPKDYPAFERGLTRIDKPQFWLGADEADVGEAEGLGGYAPQDLDLRPLVERQIRERRGQSKFRDALRKRYGDRCLATGCDVPAVLEAAHIHPHRGVQDNDPENGLLLRADVHTLFDLDLLGIEPDGLQIELHPDVTKEYGQLTGKKLPCGGKLRPSREALQERYEQFKKRLQRSG